MQIDTKKLMSALDTIRPGTDKREIVNQSSFYGFKDDYIYTYNDEITVSTKLKTGIECYVNADDLFNLLNRVNDKEITIDVVNRKKKDKEKGSNEFDADMVVSGKKFKATLAGYRKSNLRDLKTVDIKDSEFTELPDNFIDMLKMCRMSVDTDMSRPALTCIHWLPDKLESCDNFRVTQYKGKFPNVCDDGVLLHKGCIDQLIKFKPTHYCFTGDNEWVHFKIGNACIFSSRIFSGTYPKLDNVAGMIDNETIHFLPSMTDVLQRALIFAKSNDTIAGTEQALIEIKGTHVKVAVSAVRGSFSESARIKAKSDFKFEIRIRALIDILSSEFSSAILDEKVERLKFSTDDMIHIVALLSN